MHKVKVTMSWSGGKDSAFALYKVLSSGNYDVVNLHTVFGEDTKRVGLHGVREELVEEQARCLKIPLTKLYLKTANDHEAYSDLMKTFYRRCGKEGLEGIVFGDIFLEDLKKFREALLAGSGLTPVFPIWKLDSRMLVDDFVNAGFKTLICSADASRFAEEQVGQTIDHPFIENLPPGVDPCGENGEFHTFVYDGPVFQKPVTFTAAGVIKQSYAYRRTNEDGSLTNLESSFWFQELLPQSA